MIDLQLSSDDWDLVIVNGDLGMVALADQVVQHIRQRLQTVLAEWFLDLSVGVPWFEDILGKPQRLSVVEATLKEVITGTPGVTELAAFNIQAEDAVNRIVSVTFTVVVSGEEINQTVEMTV